MGSKRRGRAALAAMVAACLASAPAAGTAWSAPVPRAKVADRAKSAEKVDGLSASKRPRAGRLLALNSRGQFPSSVFSPILNSPSIQRPLTSTCPQGQAIRGVTRTGAVTCTVAGLSLPLAVELGTPQPLLSLTNIGAGGALDLVSSSSWASGYFRNRGTGAALRAESAGNGPMADGVYSSNAGADGFAVRAELLNGANPSAALYARTQGGGQAIDAEIPEGSSAGDALFARTLSDDPESYAGFFSGNVRIDGNLTVNGTITENEPPPPGVAAAASAAGSGGARDLADGIVTTDARGLATVRLPSGFGAGHRAFRYQLTTIRSFARAVVWREVRDGRLTIRTSRPGVRVSWQVTGARR